MGFKHIVPRVRDGKPVAAGEVNRPVDRLANNGEYLWELIQAAGIGSTIFARERTVEADCLAGMPVFFNASTQRFERALAATVFDTTLSQMASAPSANIWGIVYKKTNATLADILLFGFIQMDVSAAIVDGETLTAGLYHLSGTTPGKVTLQRPAIAIPVFRTDGNGGVFVNAQWEDVLNAHSHLHFPLRPLPAGVTSEPADGDPHVITEPDIDIEGWLPADHVSFNGNAPTGAKFGYNFTANPALRRAWPPLPPENAVLVWDGTDADSSLDGIVRFDNNGIWWMTDCKGDVPWPFDLAPTLEQLSEWSDSATGVDGCYDFPMRLELYFTKFSFFSDTTVVTSLTSTDARIVIECAGKPGVPASVGPLTISLDLAFLLGLSNVQGYLAFKTFDPATGKFHRGPVAEGLYAKTGNVTLTGDLVTTRTIESEDSESDSTTEVQVYHGLVGVSVDNPDSRELFPTLARLNGVTEEFTSDIMYLAFPAGELSELRARFNVPDSLDVLSPQVSIKLRLLATGAGTLPDLTLTVRRIPKTVGTAQATLPTSDTPVALTSGFTAALANKYLDVLSDPFDVAAGDDVFITLSRSNDDAYTFEIGLLRLVAVVTSSS